MILITGSAGKTGLHIARNLVNKGYKIKAFLHKQEYIEKLKLYGVNNYFVGDIRNENDVEKSLGDVNSVYYICPNATPDEFLLGKLFIEKSRNIGIEHFIYHSVLYPQIGKMPHHWNKLLVEEELINSGLNYTIIQPAIYMQNLLGQIDSSQKSTTITLPYNSNSKLSMVDLDDVGQVVTTMVLNPKHYHATYSLIGEAAISYNDIKDIFKDKINKNIDITEINLTKWEHNALQSGFSQEKISILKKMFEYYDRYGFIGNTNILECLLGHKPTSIKEFITKNYQI